MDDNAVPLPPNAEVHISCSDGGTSVTVRDAEGEPLEVSAIELGTIMTIAIMTVGANILREE